MGFNMSNKRIIFLSILVFMIVLSLGTVSAISDDSEGVLGNSSSTVSGGVDVVTENPWNTTGELNYDIPSNAEIKQASVYVNVYGGSAKNTHGANANVTLITDNGENQLASEQLWIEDGSTDGTVYTVNNHTTKCYSDYMMYYDITDSIKGLNGTHITLDVKTFEMENKTFDGRIKLLGLIIAYDDGDKDTISYWVNDDQLWTKTNATITFDTELTDIIQANLTNILLSSGDGSYKLNGELLGDADEHVSGNYYMYNKWDVTDYLTNSSTELISSYAGTSSYGSLKNVLSVLIANHFVLQTDVTLATEYSKTCYAGTNNTITVTVNTNKKANYKINLKVDGEIVDTVEKNLTEDTETLLLTDPTIRPVDETTVNGANNTQVNYTVELLLDDELVNSEELIVPVLYNGNLGKDLEYPAVNDTIDKYVINGEVGFIINDESSYMAAGTLNRSDVWTLEFDNDTQLVKAFAYVPYNWWNPNLNGTITATFNGNEITPVSTFTDQSNLGTYGRYAYGLYVYDVTDLIQNGENTLFINKTAKTPAVYPSALIYLYNVTEPEHIQTVYIKNGADLLSNSNNVANRSVKSDSKFDISLENITSASVSIFAASAQPGEGNIVFNGKTFEDVWTGTSSTNELFVIDATDLINESNSISFAATGSTILALQQIIIASEDFNLAPTAISIVGVNGNAEVSGVLKDIYENPVSNVCIECTIGNETLNVTTDDGGAFTVQAKDNSVVDLAFAGNKDFKKSSASIKLENITSANTTVVKKDAVINVDSTFTRNATDYFAEERGGFFYATLTDIDGNPLVNKTVQIAVNGPIYNVTTDDQGRAGLQVNLAVANVYTYALSFSGDDEYNAAPLASSKLTVITKKTTISASSKTFKATAKTKKVTVTLKTIKNAFDGKTYLKTGKKLTLKVNGKTYTAKTGANGVAKFLIKLTKKGKFNAKIKFAGDKTYSASSKSIKITIK